MVVGVVKISCKADLVFVWDDFDFALNLDMRPFNCLCFYSRILNSNETTFVFAGLFGHKYGHREQTKTSSTSFSCSPFLFNLLLQCTIRFAL